MKNVTVFHYDAFTTTPNKGNAAGIVFDADNLSAVEMQQIALKVGFNECSFPVHSDVADIRIRYFTPGHEMDLCGHATIATLYGLLTTGRLQWKEELSIETRAGILRVYVKQDGGTIRLKMEHAKPQFIPFEGSVEELAHSIGIEVSDIHPHYPIVYGSTGIWTLCIPINSLEAFSKMNPTNELFPSILTKMPKASFHPFSLSAFDPSAHMHARHFSSPFSGTIEDAITGTASGVMGAYIATFVTPDRKELYDLVVEQGQELGKDGRVVVHVDHKNELKIAISGTAVFVKEFDITIP